ncbi:uncharacterized protein LOC100901695 [Galendromus occidentalis]|uniref:Uncharacterized protein LOC100901695 n=1 Tax=Galendromus occidentalis TaxID=34638 RepID=A0AAJ6QUT9_9ACAR|nr:uncharacterized protein LOC100901695 [Galendromus occidentalis]
MASLHNRRHSTNGAMSWKPFTFHTEVSGNGQGLKMVTVHDIGLDPRRNFGEFFDGRFGSCFKSAYVILNVWITTRDDGTPQDSYRTAEELCNAIGSLLRIYDETYVGVGYGFGAHLLSMMAVRDPKRFRALVLFNHPFRDISPVNGSLITTLGLLRARKRFEIVTAGLLDYHDMPREGYANVGYARMFKESEVTKLEGIIQACVNRPEVDPNLILCPILYIVGEDSLYVDNSRRMFDARKMRDHDYILEVPCCNVPLFEDPHVVMNAMLTFLRFLYPK